MFSSAVFVAWVSQRAALDLPLTFFVLLAIERGEVWLATGRLLPAVACGAAWAGAILVKGPLGFLFPPMALAAGALARHRVPTWRNPGWLLAPGVMAGVGLAWLLPALDAGGGAYADRLLGQIAGRATGGEGHHVRPFYYFIERFPVITMPWSLHLLAGLGAMLTLRRAPHAHRGGLATCAALAIGAFVMLSAFATKREVYLVPVLPFMAAAAAQALHRGHFRALARWGVLLLVGTPVGLALVLLGLPVLVERVQGGAWPDAAEIRWGLYAGIAPACVAFLAGAWWTLRARREPLHAVRRGAMAVTVGMTVLTLFVLPALDRYKSYAPAARAAEAAAAGGTIYNAGFGQAANLLWSLDREISPEVHDPAELGTRLPRGGPVGAAVVGQGWWDRWRAAHPAAATWLREVWREPVDHRGLLVLTNRPAPTGGG
jgi:4-amino-4-deoxy-L-arabinose transferase-like glycosyltransferase